MPVRKRIAVELVVVFVLAAFVLCFGIMSAGIASGYVDPLLHAGAQDEAVYGHAAAVMVRTGHWLTPIFLERFMLNKPPLLMWTGAASMRLLAIGSLALRLPDLIAGVLCCALVYAWLRRSHPLPAAVSGVVLLLGTPIFYSISRKFMTDALLTLCIVGAMFLIAVDPRWERHPTWIGFGLLSGAAIMTKSAAGLLPLLILAVYFAFAGCKERPRLRRILPALAVAVIAAAPWHIYQLLAHKDWFIAEYVRFQLLGSGLTAPSRYTQDTNFWFYLRTMLRTDPVLLVLAITGIPWLVITWRRGNRVEARLLAAWAVTAILCLGIFGSRAAYYLLPLLPALALMSTAFSPVFRGRLAWPACVLLVAFLCLKLWTSDSIWTLNYGPKNVPGAVALDSYARLNRGNELVIVSPDDEFYASVLNLPKIRYAYLTPLDPTKTSAFFFNLGMILSAEQFCSLDRLMPNYEQRLRAWNLPARLHPEGTLIDAGAILQLPALIHCSPDRDFMIPDAVRQVALGAAARTHWASRSIDGKFFLLSNRRRQRPAGFMAPGTLVEEPRR